MNKTVSFADLDQVNAGLKKARSVLALVQDSWPRDQTDGELEWAISAAFDYVHKAMTDIEKLVDEAAKK